VIDRDGWEIPLTYSGEKTDTRHFVTDLSHVPKWVLQGHDLDSLQPAGLAVPAKPREATLERDILLVRLNAWECCIMVLGEDIPSFEDPGYTDFTDGYAAFAIVGPQCLDLLRKLSPVDLEGPDQAPPCGAQAPVEDIRCLIVRLQGKNAVPGLIISGPRGYGHFLLEIFMDAGEEYGITVAGWQRFRDWLKDKGLVD
jgi:glycine cleavage system aminomethyltransferase T